MSETISLHMCIPLAAVLLAALTDLKSFKIHNIVSIPLLFSGMAYHAMAHGWEAFAASLLGALFGFFVLMPLYIAGGMGAGDVKLLAAVGAWLGLPQTFYVFVASSLAAGIYALALMTWYQTGGEIVGNLKIIWHRMKILGRHLAQE